MESDIYKLDGMDNSGAKEYILGFITTLKMTEKEIRVLEDEKAKWEGRIRLARSRGMTELVSAAEKESEKVNARLADIKEEERKLRNGIDKMRQQLPGLAARERSIDPDLLEQEILMLLGRTEEEAGTERAFRKLENENAAAEALEALKLKMKANAG